LINRKAAAVRSLPQIFAVPVVLGALSAAGLVIALVGDGAWDLLGWAALGLPILVAGRYCFIQYRRS